MWAHSFVTDKAARRHARSRQSLRAFAVDAALVHPHTEGHALLWSGWGLHASRRRAEVPALLRQHDAIAALRLIGHGQVNVVH